MAMAQGQKFIGRGAGSRSAIEFETEGIDMANQLENERSLVFSYLLLRKAIGVPLPYPLAAGVASGPPICRFEASEVADASYTLSLPR